MFLQIAMTLPAASHLEAKRKARSISMGSIEYMRSLIRKDLEGDQQMRDLAPISTPSLSHSQEGLRCIAPRRTCLRFCSGLK